jgi:hypothetical protein
MTKMQELFNRQHEQLTKLEASIVQTKKELDQARTEALASLKQKRDQAAVQRRVRQQKMTDAFDEMKASMQEKKQEAEATVEEWKRKREVNKLEGRAQSAQEYAEAAIHVVGLALDEATAATLDAAEARRVADEAKKAAAS